MAIKVASLVVMRSDVSAVAAASNMYDALMDTSDDKSRGVVDNIFIEVDREEQALLIDLLAYFSVVKHINPNYFSWVYSDVCPSIGMRAQTYDSLPFGITKHPALTYDGSYIIEYDQLKIVELNTVTAFKTILFLTNILVPDPNTWTWSPKDAQEFIKGIHYGDISADITQYYDLIVLKFALFGPYSATEIDTNEVTLAYTKEMHFSAAEELLSDATDVCNGVLTGFFKVEDTIEWFTFLQGTTRRMFLSLYRRGNGPYDPWQSIYEYRIPDPTPGVPNPTEYEFISVWNVLYNQPDRTEHYYTRTTPGGIETITEVFTSAAADYKKTTEYFCRFFSADNSLYLYRINYKLSTFSPKYSYIGSRIFNHNSPLCNDTVITVDKLLKSDPMTVIESYPLSVSGAQADRRLDTRFDLADLGLSYDASAFGFARTNCVLITNLGDGLTNIDTFNGATGGSDIVYNEEYNEGFSCVVPLQGVVLMSGGVEYPMVFGQYVTINEINRQTAEDATMLLTDESVVCLLGDHVETATLKPLGSFGCARVVNASSQMPNGLTDMATEYALETLPRINSLASDGGTAFFACPQLPVSSLSWEKYKPFGGSYEGMVSIADGAPVLVTAPAKDFYLVDFSTLVAQAGIANTGNTVRFSGSVNYLNDPAYPELQLVAGNAYTVKMYVVTEFTYTDGKKYPKTVVYNGILSVLFSTVFKVDEYNTVNNMAVQPADWGTFSLGSEIYFDMLWSNDILMVKQGV